MFSPFVYLCHVSAERTILLTPTVEHSVVRLQSFYSNSYCPSICRLPLYPLTVLSAEECLQAHTCETCSLQHVRGTLRQRHKLVLIWSWKNFMDLLGKIKSNHDMFITSSNHAWGVWGPIEGCEKYKYNMLILLIRVLVISDKLSVVFYLPFCFDILNDGLCLYSLWSSGGHSVSSVLWVIKGKWSSVSSCSFLPRMNPRTMLPRWSGWGGVWYGWKGVLFLFLICNKHNCVIKKKKMDFFPNIFKICVLVPSVLCFVLACSESTRRYRLFV